MRKFLVAISFLVAGFAHAEASFDQIESLIQQKNYAAAEAGLEVIVKNHPQSAKAFYAMAQAQAGLGNLEKAQKALNIATGLNPTLDFAPADSVAKLKQAITPQVAKIEAVEESHFWRDFILGFVLFSAVGTVIYILYVRKKEREEREEQEAYERARQAEREELAQQIRESSKKAKLSDIVTKPTKQVEATASQPTASLATSGPAVQQPLYTPQPTTTVVNNSNDGLLTGILIGDMLSHHNHDTTRVVEREVIREVPAPSRDTSWDDTPSRSSSRSSSRDTSWDDDSSSSSSSSSRSSSWDDSSSSSSSSSWSSSSSDSSSSWSDSSSSSSSSDW